MCKKYSLCSFFLQWDELNIKTFFQFFQLSSVLFFLAINLQSQQFQYNHNGVDISLTTSSASPLTLCCLWIVQSIYLVFLCLSQRVVIVWKDKDSLYPQCFDRVFLASSLRFSNVNTTWSLTQQADAQMNGLFWSFYFFIRTVKIHDANS